MSLVDLVSNLETFLRILRRSFSDEIRNWSQQELQTAFNWAQYAQTAYEKSVGKSHFLKIQEKFEQFPIQFRTFGTTKVSFESLKEAEYILFKGLLQNIHSTDAIYTAVLTYVANKHGKDRWTSIFVEKIAPIIRLKAQNAVFEVFLQSLAVYDDSVAIKNQTESNYLVMLIYDYFCIMVSSSSNGGTYALQVLRSLLKEEKNYEILLKLLSKAFPERLSYGEVYKSVRRCFNECLASREPKTMEVVLLHPDSILRQVCLESYSTFRHYSAYLVCAARGFRQRDVNGSLLWRHPGIKDERSYSMLEEHVRLVFSAEDKVSFACRCLFRKLSCNTVNIWTNMRCLFILNNNVNNSISKEEQ